MMLTDERGLDLCYRDSFASVMPVRLLAWRGRDGLAALLRGPPGWCPCLPNVSGFGKRSDSQPPRDAPQWACSHVPTTDLGDEGGVWPRVAGLLGTRCLRAEPRPGLSPAGASASMSVKWVCPSHPTGENPQQGQSLCWPYKPHVDPECCTLFPECLPATCWPFQALGWVSRCSLSVSRGWASDS